MYLAHHLVVRRSGITNACWPAFQVNEGLLTVILITSPSMISILPSPACLKRRVERSQSLLMTTMRTREMKRSANHSSRPAYGSAFIRWTRSAELTRTQ